MEAQHDQYAISAAFINQVGEILKSHLDGHPVELPEDAGAKFEDIDDGCDSDSCLEGVI